jgi:hypothetical protein
MSILKAVLRIRPKQALAVGTVVACMFAAPVTAFACQAGPAGGHSQSDSDKRGDDLKDLLNGLKGDRDEDNDHHSKGDDDDRDKKGDDNDGESESSGSKPSSGSSGGQTTSQSGPTAITAPAAVAVSVPTTGAVDVIIETAAGALALGGSGMALVGLALRRRGEKPDSSI